MKITINRRTVLKSMAGALITATAATSTIAALSQPSTFDAGAYIDAMTAQSDLSLRPAILIKDGREIGVSGWLPETLPSRDRQHYEAFKAELKKRRLYQVWTQSKMVDDETGEVIRFATYQPIGRS